MNYPAWAWRCLRVVFLLWATSLQLISAFQSPALSRIAGPPASYLTDMPNNSRTSSLRPRALLLKTQLETRLHLAPFSTAQPNFKLPSCSPNDALSVGITAGLTGLILQTLLWKVLNRSKDPIWNKDAGYSAHNFVAFGLMVLVSIVGSAGWFFGESAAAATTTLSVAEQLLSVPSDSARWLAAVVAGMFIFWDIPTSIVIPRLRKQLDLLVHHVVMAAIACLSATVLPVHYIFYYFGVAELSSVPLVIYDQLAHACDVQTNQSQQDDNAVKKEMVLKKLRDNFQIVAAISFTVVRAYSFTKVTLTRFLPNCYSVLPALTSSSMKATLKLIMGASVGFTVLQLYWFSSMVKVMLGKEAS